MRICEVLDRAAASLHGALVASPRLDAELLLCRTLGLQRAELLLRAETTLDSRDRERFERSVERRASGTPIAYLIGEREFGSLAFRVDPRVLVPRPETEHLVDEAVRIAREMVPRRVLAIDIGTGSGAIAVVLAYRTSRLRVVATDRLAGPLEVARHNARRHGVAHRLDFLRADLLDPFDRRKAVDLVLSNPPYVTDEAMERVAAEVRHEPAEALRCGSDPLSFHRRIAEGARRVLRPGGHLLLEVGSDPPLRVEEVSDWLCEAKGYEEVRLLPDLRGMPRVLCARRSAGTI